MAGLEVLCRMCHVDEHASPLAREKRAWMKFARGPIVKSFAIGSSSAVTPGRGAEYPPDFTLPIANSFWESYARAK